MLFDDYTEDEVEHFLSVITQCLVSNETYDDIVPVEYCDLLTSMAKARKKNKKAEHQELYFTEDNLRFATPEVVANYRASRMGKGVIFDVCCGVGLQAIACARHARHVVGCDIDAQKVQFAQLNAHKCGVTNVTFVCADALSDEMIVRAQEKDVDVVFCDPQRPPAEKERKLESIQPSIPELVQKYGALTDAIVIEFPPFLAEKQDLFEGELEFMSLHGENNRCALYMGSLARAKRSVIALPSGNTFCGEKKEVTLAAPQRFIGELDCALVRSHLIQDFCDSLKVRPCIVRKRRAYCTSNEIIEHGLIPAWYEVVAQTSNLKEGLKESNAQEVILRYEIDPTSYAEQKRWMEGMCSGTDKIIIFKTHDEYVFTKEC